MQTKTNNQTKLRLASILADQAVQIDLTSAKGDVLANHAAAQYSAYANIVTKLMDADLPNITPKTVKLIDNAASDKAIANSALTELREWTTR